MKFLTGILLTIGFLIAAMLVGGGNCAPQPQRGSSQGGYGLSSDIQFGLGHNGGSGQQRQSGSEGCMSSSFDSRQGSYGQDESGRGGSSRGQYNRQSGGY